MRGYMVKKIWRMKVKKREREERKNLLVFCYFRNFICSIRLVYEVLWDLFIIVELLDNYSFMNDFRKD